MAGLYAPLPTLRSHPRGGLRTDRGRRGWLLLHRSGLSPHTPCRSPGALTRVTAHRIAQPPKATFVTRLRPFRSPGRAARQLPDQSTILWVDSSSTGDSRLRGALPYQDCHAVVTKELGRRSVSRWWRCWCSRLVKLPKALLESLKSSRQSRDQRAHI